MAFLCETPEPTPAPPAVVLGQNAADPLFRDAFNKVFTRADQIAGRAYQPYGSQRIADLTPDTLSSFDVTRQNVGSYQPFVGLAGAQAAQAGMSLPQRNLGDYMNPYVQNVVDVAKREAIRGDSIAQQGRNYSASKAGAFGGSRHALMEAEAQRNLGQRLDDIQTQGQAAAYDKALTAINQDSQNQVRSAAVLGDLGQKSQQLGYGDATALDTIGTRQQTQAQANLDTAYGDFNRQQDWDRNQIQFLSSILGSAPNAAANTGYTTTTTQFTPQASPIAQGAGLATAGIGAYGLGKWAGLFKEGGKVQSYDDGGLVTLSDDQLINLYGRMSAPPEQRTEALMELRRRGVNPFGRPRIKRDTEAKTMRGEPATFAWGPKAAPAQAGARQEEAETYPDESGRGLSVADLGVTPVPQTNGFAIGPAVTLADFQRPEAPRQRLSLGNAPSGSFKAPQFPNAPAQGESPLTTYENSLGSMKTPQQARADVQEVKPNLLEDPNKGMPRWVMPVIQAGLSMMQAKPGQSALSGIGAGAQAGVAQMAQDRKEAMELERENERRRERAQDLTERQREAAAGDARSTRQEAATRAQLTSEQARQVLDRYRAELSKAVSEGQLSVSAAQLRLQEFQANVAARVAENSAETSGAYAAAAVRPNVVGVDEEGNAVTLGVDGKPKTLRGVRPTASLGIEQRRDAAYNSAVARARQAAIKELGLGEMLPGQTRSVADLRRIEDRVRQILASQGYEQTDLSGMMGGPPPIR